MKIRDLAHVAAKWTPVRRQDHAQAKESRALRAVPLVAVLALGLTLSACDKCGDFFWDKPGSCKSGPAPN